MIDAVDPLDGPKPPSDDQGPPDRELLEGIREGSVSALETALRRHWAPLYRSVFRILQSPDQSEEVVQQAFVALWERRTGLDPTGSLTGFLYRTARNRALNQKRDQSARTEKGNGHAEELQAARAPDPHRELERQTLRREVVAAVNRLPPRQREIFVLAKYQGLSRREIAHVLELAPQTVANHLSAALTALRAALRPLLEEFEGGWRTPDTASPTLGGAGAAKRARRPS